MLSSKHSKEKPRTKHLQCFEYIPSPVPKSEKKSLIDFTSREQLIKRKQLTERVGYEAIQIRYVIQGNQIVSKILGSFTKFGGLDPLFLAMVINLSSN